MASAESGPRPPRRYPALAALAACALLLSVYSVMAQLRVLQFPYVSDGGPQIEFHYSILRGEAASPYQYRVLSEYLVEGLLRAWQSSGLPGATAGAFIVFRFLQNAAIFFVGALYYRRLGLSVAGALVACSLLAWGMTQSLYDSGLSFDTYSDVLAYLAAGLLIAARKDAWIIPLAAAAAANRETAGLIPLMLLATRLSEGASPRPALRTAGLALLAYAAVVIGLRVGYGPRDVYVAYGHTMGMDLFRYNVLRLVTWTQLLATVGIVPLIALAGYRRWPRPLQRFLWAVVPVWAVVHLCGAVLAETRLLLAPHALVFVPGALFAVLDPRSTPLTAGNAAAGGDRPATA